MRKNNDMWMFVN